MLDFEGVSRSFPDGPRVLHALREVTMQVAAGEFVAVMGPSGSGKTTLVNLAAGIDRPDQGRVLVDGTDLGSLSDRGRARLRRRRIGVVHQQDNLHPLLTAVENTTLPMRLDGAWRGPAREAGLVALERSGVAELADRFPHQLSGGERQRVGVARAIVGDRSLLVADEPTAAVDTPTARTLVELLAEVSRAGTAVVMTTHDSRLATFADRVILLRDGTPTRADAPPPIQIGAGR